MKQSGMPGLPVIRRVGGLEDFEGDNADMLRVIRRVGGLEG